MILVEHQEYYEYEVRLLILYICKYTTSVKTLMAKNWKFGPPFGYSMRSQTYNKVFIRVFVCTISF